jgi:hypothetical protein
MNDNFFGTTLVLKGNVVCNEEDEDLKLYAKCCEHVCKIYNEISNEDKKTSNQEKENSHATE